MRIRFPVNDSYIEINEITQTVYIKYQYYTATLHGDTFEDAYGHKFRYTKTNSYTLIPTFIIDTGVIV